MYLRILTLILVTIFSFSTPTQALMVAAPCIDLTKDACAQNNQCEYVIDMCTQSYPPTCQGRCKMKEIQPDPQQCRALDENTCILSEDCVWRPCRVPCKQGDPCPPCCFTKKKIDRESSILLHPADPNEALKPRPFVVPSNPGPIDGPESIELPKPGNTGYRQPPGTSGQSGGGYIPPTGTVGPGTVNSQEIKPYNYNTRPTTK